MLFNEFEKKEKNEMIADYIRCWLGVDQSQRACWGLLILIKNHFKMFITNIQYISDILLSVDESVWPKSHHYKSICTTQLNE